MKSRWCFLWLSALSAAGCVRVTTAPIEVKPIHVTVDVNVKVNKDLDDYFGDVDKKSSTVEPTAKPASTP